MDNKELNQSQNEKKQDKSNNEEVNLVEYL